MTDEVDKGVPPEVQRRYEAAEAEEAQFLHALHPQLRVMHLAQIEALVRQVDWLRARTVDLNIALRERDEELASLRAQLAGYQMSERIEQAAAEPGTPDPAP